MKNNMGNTDRIIRLIAAAVFIYLYASGTVPGIPGIVLTVLAVVFILTSVVRFCPLYLPFNINTNKKVE